VVAVGSPIANVMNNHLDQAALASALRNTGYEIGRENFAEKCKNIETHHAFILAQVSRYRQTSEVGRSSRVRIP